MNLANLVGSIFDFIVTPITNNDIINKCNVNYCLYGLQYSIVYFPPSKIGNNQEQKTIDKKTTKKYGGHFIYGIHQSSIRNENEVLAADQQDSQNELVIHCLGSYCTVDNIKSEGKWNEKYYNNGKFTAFVESAYIIESIHHLK